MPSKKQTPSTPKKAPEVQPPGASFRQKKMTLAAALVISELDDDERGFLAACQCCYRNHSGFTSPFEELFSNLVFYVIHGCYPTPEELRKDVMEFEENLGLMKEYVSQFLLRYPEAARRDIELTAA